jgi:hypothetical protein
MRVRSTFVGNRNRRANVGRQKGFLVVFFEKNWRGARFSLHDFHVIARSVEASQFRPEWADKGEDGQQDAGRKYQDKQHR